SYSVNMVPLSFTVENVACYLNTLTFFNEIIPLYRASETNDVIYFKNNTFDVKSLALFRWIEDNYPNQILAFAIINPATGSLIDSDANIISFTKSSDDLTLTFRLPINNYSITSAKLSQNNNLLNSGIRCQVISSSSTSVTFRVYDENNTLNPNALFAILIYV
ncbi:MAG: hypothetical protein N2Z58_09415, partial [Fervidobacterium sp.]|nr:hypothetical protein [Fervidobacterium sp.]